MVLPVQGQQGAPGQGAPGQGAPGQGAPGQGAPGQGGTPTLTYDTWLAQQPENVRTLVEGNIQGLRNTVIATRTERDGLSKRLADIAKSLGKDPTEAARLLSETSDQLEDAAQRAAFYEEASASGIGCADPKLAFIAAREGGLIDKKGRVDWEGLKKLHPTLFQTGAPVAPGHAGAGTGAPPVTKPDMNILIRRAIRRT